MRYTVCILSTCGANDQEKDGTSEIGRKPEECDKVAELVHRCDAHRYEEVYGVSDRTLEFVLAV